MNIIDPKGKPRAVTNTCACRPRLSQPSVSGSTEQQAQISPLATRLKSSKEQIRLRSCSAGLSFPRFSPFHPLSSPFKGI